MSAEPMTSPSVGPVAPAVRDLQRRITALEAHIVSIVQRQAAVSGPIRRAFFGVVTEWQGNRVSVAPMPFGDPNDWLTADYSDEDAVICDCFAPYQLFIKYLTPVEAVQYWNTDRPIVRPLHLMTDDHADPELPYWEPEPDELEDAAAFTGVPPSMDDINCPGGE